MLEIAGIILFVIAVVMMVTIILGVSVALVLALVRNKPRGRTWRGL